MEGLIQFGGQFAESLKRELIGDSVLRVTSLAEPFKLALLTRAQTFDASREMGLSQ